jgi:beta-lactamase superfamily II metal-dependent hydrolase
MLIDIHDVGHGACAVVTSSSGKKIMIDAGYCSDPYWFPSAHYYGQRMEMLFAQNLDTDHVDDVEAVLENLAVQSFRTNPSITADAFLAMKSSHGLNDSLRKVHSLLKTHGGDYGYLPHLDEVHLLGFFHRYGAFTNTNDLSAPLFVSTQGFTILFSGDLETAGWQAFLRDPYFTAMLSKVRILVASHHGRENGCCDELFNYCFPEVVVISDYGHRHLTQQTTNWYRYRAEGIPDYSVRQSGLLVPQRYVLTTRSDGNIRIQVHADGRYEISLYPHVDPKIYEPLFAKPDQAPAIEMSPIYKAFFG